MRRRVRPPTCGARVSKTCFDEPRHRAMTTISPHPSTPADAAPAGRVLALCGGVGGAKLALGLQSVVAPGQLTLAVNTGDDFEFLGLHISPDLDTVLYTLAGLNDTA